MLASCLLGICAHLIVRRPCPECLEEVEPSPHEREQLGRLGDDARGRSIVRPVGCVLCEGRGYTGCVGLHELLVTDDRIRELIRDEAQAEELARAARQAGGASFLDDGLDKMWAHRTTLAEVVRVVATVAT